MAAAFASTPVATSPRNQIWQGRDPAVVIAEYLQKFSAEIAGLPAEITLVVLSAEQFSHWIRNPADIRRLHAALAPHFDEISVVVYLRRQDAHYASNHAQMIRLGHIEAPDMTQLSPFWHDYDYTQLIGRWAACFGEQAMQPRIFERLPGRPFNVVADFFQLCGIAMPSGLENAMPERNLSIDLTGQHILREVEGLMRGHGRMDAELRSSVTWQRIGRSVSKARPGAGWQPTRAEAVDFMAGFAACNEQVRQRWFPERASLFSEDFTHLPKTAPVVDYETAFKAACGVILDVVTDAVRQQQQFLRASSARAAKANETVRQRVALTRAVKLDGTDIKSRLSLARLQIDEGAVDTARHHLELVLKSSPEHPIASRLMKRLSRLAEQKRKVAKLTAASPGFQN
jgi:hypothetical protein